MDGEVDPVKYGSICTGTAQLDAAVEQLWGAEPAWFAEVDKDACKVLARHYPHVPNLGDIRAVDWSSVEPVDLICGGIPCQPWSAAGQRKGVDDERHLWPYAERAIRVLRPRYVVVEEVPGFVTGGGLDLVLADLCALGFDAAWGTLAASAIGACHQRERLFILAADASSARRGGDARAALGQEEPSGRSRARLGDLAASLGDGLPVADAHGVRREGWPLVALDGTPAAGCSEGPPAHANGERRGAWDGRTPRPSGGGIELDRLGTEPVLARMPDGSVRDYGPALRRHAAVLGRPWPSPTIGRSLNGDFSAWMMMMPEGWLDGLSNGAKKRLAGNAVVTPQAVAALAQLRDRLLAHAEVAA